MSEFLRVCMRGLNGMQAPCIVRLVYQENKEEISMPVFVRGRRMVSLNFA